MWPFHFGLWELSDQIKLTGFVPSSFSLDYFLLIFLPLFPEVINSFFLPDFQPKLSVQPDQSSSSLAHLLTYLAYFVFWFLTLEGKSKFSFSIRIHYSIGNNMYNNPVPVLAAVTLFFRYQPQSRQKSCGHLFLTIWDKFQENQTDFFLPIPLTSVGHGRMNLLL